jgi:NADH pyrophosphatase NudC (nudix superfamily)
MTLEEQIADVYQEACESHCIDIRKLYTNCKFCPECGKEIRTGDSDGYCIDIYDEEICPDCGAYINE